METTAENAAVVALREEHRRRELVYLALIAEEAGRFDDTLSTMFRVAKMGSGLTDAERRLFYTSFKKLLEKKTYVWNIAADILKDQRRKDNECAVKMAQEYRFKIEKEVKEMCNSVLDVIDNHLVPSSLDAETFIYFQKMAADCHYEVAFLINSSVKLMVNDKSYGTVAGLFHRMEMNVVFAKFLEAQERVWRTAKEKLPATSPIRLTLALNLSNMLYKLDHGGRAYQLVEEVYADAKSELKSKIQSKETKELMSALEHYSTMLGSIDDGAYRRVLVNQKEHQFVLPEGVKLLEHDLTVVGSLCDGAYRRGLVKQQEQQSVLPEGGKVPEHGLTIVGSIGDGAYRRVLVNQQEQQPVLQEGGKQGSNPADEEPNCRDDEELYKMSRNLPGRTGQERWWWPMKRKE